MECKECGSIRLYKDGLRYLSDGSSVQRFLCRDCGHRFSESVVKLDVISEVIKGLDSGPNLRKGAVCNVDFSSDKSGDDSSFALGKDSSVHNDVNVGKELNTLLSYNSNCQICARRAKNLTTALEINTIAGEGKETTKGKILQFVLWLKLQGCSEHTVKGWGQKLNRLAKNADLSEPESVKKCLAFLDIAESSKHAFCVAYGAFLKWQGRTWTVPKYKGTQKIPDFIPTEKEIDALIAGCGKKTSTILQVLKETGMRIGECVSLTWSSVNAEAHTITLNTPEKNSLPRIFKVSSKLIGMLEMLPKDSDKIFGRSNSRNASVCLAQQRKKIAKKLVNPRIAKIHFHLIRHWKGTMEYHKTQNIIQVQKLLGHKSILNTQIYVNLEQAIFEANDNYEVKIAETIDEASKLLEVGFEYVTEMDGKKLFRKRK